MSGYIRKKLKVLRDFRVVLSDAELRHLKSLQQESDIDRFARELILKAIA